MLKLQHKKLNVWKTSLHFIGLIYRLTGSFPSYEKFGLTTQLRRVAISVASNFAEGAARTSRKEQRRFFEIARSSLVEIDTQLVISQQLGYLPEEAIPKVDQYLNDLFAMLTGLMAKT